VIAWISYVITLLFIICGCSISIWRKFHHGSLLSQQQNRASQNKRLTKTLQFVSILALLSWLPLLIMNILAYVLEVSITWRFPLIATFLNFSNAFLNPVVYAFRFPEFRQALSSCCFRRSAALNIVDIKRRIRRLLI